MLRKDTGISELISSGSMCFLTGIDYREGLDLDPVDFYRQLETIEDPKNHLPSTAMPDTEEITGLFEKAISDGYSEIIVFSLSSGLGGTYNKIRLLAEDYQDRIKIHTVDTKITCFGEGFLAIRAAEFARNGMSSEDILKEIAWMMRRQVFMGVDGKLGGSFQHGRRNRRAGKCAYPQKGIDPYL